MKRLTTAASSGPLSSWRKWPPPSIVVCGWPPAPGIGSAEHAVGPRGDRVAVAERGEERLVEPLERLPRGAVRLGARGRRATSAPASGTGARPPCRSRRGTARRRRRSPRAARSVAQPPLTMPPTWKSGVVLARTRCQREERVARRSRSPVGRNVLAATTRAKRSGCSATRRRPMSPPQSWHDERDAGAGRARRTAPRASSRRGAGRCSRSRGGRLVGAAEADEVGRDARGARRRSSTGIILR